jgi:hypothetical protein
MVRFAVGVFIGSFLTSVALIAHSVRRLPVYELR